MGGSGAQLIQTEAPALECYLHLPQVDSLDSEINTRDSTSDISSEAVGLNDEVESEQTSQLEEMNVTTLETPAEADGTADDRVEPKSKPARRPTRLESDERGQTRLVTDPFIVNGNTARRLSPRRPASLPR